jgi:FKBP-type peptidyl-prolyl cis-trans isomerase
LSIRTLVTNVLAATAAIAGGAGCSSEEPSAPPPPQERSAPPADAAPVADAGTPGRPADAAQAGQAAESPAAAVSAPASQDPPIPEDTEVVTTDSGLQYSVLAPGEEGQRPKAGDKVKVHYSGWLTDGKMFDSSVRRGSPSEFTLGEGQVIAGWDEGIALMDKGARYKLTIPYALAYGEQGRPPVIPPKSTLVFQVELIDFTPAPPMPPFHEAIADAQKKTDSGLVYEVLREGEGETPERGEVVELRYAIWNTDGKLLDCTEKQGGTIKGPCSTWRIAFLNEAAQLLRPGARYRFEVPPELAFGAQSQGPDLPPNSPSIWEVELVRTIPPLPVPEFKAPDAERQLRTPSGLAYEIVRDGTGDVPKPTDEVTVHYAGWLTDGTLFDSSYGRGEPTSFPLRGVIPGWTEGLQLMREGAIYRFAIPSELAYGPRGSPPTIPPDAALIFQVELIRVGPE